MALRRDLEVSSDPAIDDDRTFARCTTNRLAAAEAETNQGVQGSRVEPVCAKIDGMARDPDSHGPAPDTVASFENRSARTSLPAETRGRDACRTGPDDRDVDLGGRLDQGGRGNREQQGQLAMNDGVMPLSREPCNPAHGSVFDEARVCGRR